LNVRIQALIHPHGLRIIKKRRKKKKREGKELTV
jgi:hypothetical protein